MHFTRDSAPPGDCREGHWDEQKNVSFIAKGTPISVSHPTRRVWLCRKCADRQSGDDHCPCFSVASTRRWRLTGKAEMTTVRASVSQVPDVDAWPAKRRWPLSVLPCRKYPTLTRDRRKLPERHRYNRLHDGEHFEHLRGRVTDENCQNDAATIDYMTESISNIFAVAGPCYRDRDVLKEGFMERTQVVSFILLIWFISFGGRN